MWHKWISPKLLEQISSASIAMAVDHWPFYPWQYARSGEVWAGHVPIMRKNMRRQKAYQFPVNEPPDVSTRWPLITKRKEGEMRLQAMSNPTYWSLNTKYGWMCFWKSEMYLPRVMRSLHIDKPAVVVRNGGHGWKKITVIAWTGSPE